MSKRPGRDPGNRAKGRWIFAAKLGFTTIVLAYLFAQIDLGDSARAFGRANGLWLILGFLVMGLGLVLSALKWDLLLRALGIFASKRALLEVYVIGFFISRVLPGIVAGDLVRWDMIGRTTGGRLKVAATILIERVTGFIALMCLCPLVLVVAVPELLTLPVIALIGGMTATLVGCLVLSLNRRLATVVMFRVRRLRIRGVFRRLYELHRTLRTFPRKPLLAALAYSVLFYLSIGAGFFLICVAFSAEVSFIEAFAVQCLTSLLIAIPISVGGLGLAQAGDVYLFGILGLSAPVALAISLMRQLVNYGYSAIGAILFVRWRPRLSPGGATDPAATRRRPKEMHAAGVGTLSAADER